MTGSHEVVGSIPIGSTFSIVTSASYVTSVKLFCNLT